MPLDTLDRHFRRNAHHYATVLTDLGLHMCRTMDELKTLPHPCKLHVSHFLEHFPDDFLGDFLEARRALWQTKR
jgi:hypothetical protein